MQAAAADDTAREVYGRAVAAMDGLPQPPYVTFRIEGSGPDLGVGLTVISNNVWLAIRSEGSDATWSLRHRTYDYASEIVDAADGRRYVTRRSFFDPTWYGAYRALREGMLESQDPAPPRAAPGEPTPAPGTLRTIGTVAVMGPAIYDVADRGSAACPDGSAGHALHLTSRKRDRMHQLSDVTVEARTSRFCAMRYSVRQGFGFAGIVDVEYGDVGGYWMETGGAIEGTFRTFGIASHHGVWRFRFLDTAFPASLPAGAFAPSAPVPSASPLPAPSTPP